MPQTVPHRRPNSAYPFLGEFRMRSVLAPSFFTFKYPRVPFLLALGFHIVLSAISFAEGPLITVYGASWCGPCRLMKNSLNLDPNGFGIKEVNGFKVNFANSDDYFPNGGDALIPAMSINGAPPIAVTAESLKATIEKIKNSGQKKEKGEEKGEDSDAAPTAHNDYQNPDQTPTPTSEGGEPKPEPKPAPPPPPAPAPPAPPAPDGGGRGNGLGQMLSQALQGLLQGGGQGSQQQQQSNQQEEQFANDNIMEMVYGTQTAVSLKTAQALATEDALSEITSEDQTDDTNSQASSDTESADVELTPTALPASASTVDPMIEIL